MSIKSDLASEIIEEISGKNLPKIKYHRFGNVDITRIEISAGEQARATCRPAGKYISVEAESVLDPTVNSDEEIAALAAELAALLPRHGTVLAVGVGNEALAADSLGAAAISAMCAGSFLGRRLCCLSTGVCGKTGFSPLEMIKSVIELTSPAAVVLVDALAAEHISHIGRTVQLTDAGICPGSGVGREQFELSAAVLGVPTVAVGMPTVIGYAESGGAEDGKTIFVAPCDIDVTVKRAARLIALAVELAVFPELGIETLKEMSY